MRRFEMRHDLIAMGTIAALAGIALAALLTVSFGSRSSGPPAALRPAQVPRTADGAAKQVTASPVAKRARVAEKKRRHKPRRHARATAPRSPAPQAGPVVAGSQPFTPTQTTPAPQQPQPVSSAAPPRAPVKQLSPPKPKGSGGGSFDDSG